MIEDVESCMCEGRTWMAGHDERGYEYTGNLIDVQSIY